MVSAALLAGVGISNADLSEQSSIVESDARTTELACNRRYNVLHLIYRQNGYEGHCKDYQCGLSTMREHWSAGLLEIRDTHAHAEWLEMPNNDAAFTTRDIHRARANAALAGDHTTEATSVGEPVNAEK